MSREKTLFIIALLIMVTPHLGLTNLLEDIVLFVFGLIILIISYGMYFAKKKAAIKKPAPPRKKVSAAPESFMPPLMKKSAVETETGFKVIKRPLPIETPDDNTPV